MCPGYDTKQSDGEVPAVLELWGMRSTPSLPSLPGSLWPSMVAPDKGPIYGLNRTNSILMLKWIVWVNSIAWNRNFANGPGDLGSIPGWVIPKTQKMVLDASLLNTQHYKVPIKGKVEQSREGVAPSPTHWCSSYRKGSLRVTLDYGRQLVFFFFLDLNCVLMLNWIIWNRTVFWH